MKRILKLIIPSIILNKYHRYRKNKKIREYSGNEVLCPICNSNHKAFAFYNDRNNARCVNCESLERHRLLWLFLNDRRGNFLNRIKLLHFAPEKSFYEFFSKQKNVEYYPCDLHPENYNYKGTVRINKVSITDIPFRNDFFDIILCNHVLEHIVDENKALIELFRVMKKGGWGIFQVPIDYNRETTYEDASITTPKEREKAFGLSDHVRIYGSDYKERLAVSGFKVVELDFVNTFRKEEVFKYGLCDKELIYLGEK